MSYWAMRYAQEQEAQKRHEMARNTEGHEIKRRWRVTYETRANVGLTIDVQAPDIAGAREFINARRNADWVFSFAEEITTPAELAAELERVKPFQEVREATQAELESKARTAAYFAKATMYRVGTVSIVLAVLAGGIATVLCI